MKYPKFKTHAEARCLLCKSALGTPHQWRPGKFSAFCLGCKVLVYYDLK